MPVPQFLETLEQSGISRWIRESSDPPFRFYIVLTLHTIGLALIVGPNAAIDLRILGVAPDIPLAPLKQWFGLMWFGLMLNVVTGILLVLAYPIKALTNPDFYVKLALIGLAVWAMVRIKEQVLGGTNLDEAARSARGRTLAFWSLGLWAGVLAAGRLLAYTCNYLLYGVPC